MNIDLSGIVANFFTGTYVVTRSATSSYSSDGRFTTPSTSTVNVKGALQPVRGRDLLHLPEGQRPEESRIFWCNVALTDATLGQLPDKLAADGFTWQVQTTFDRNVHGKFFRYVLVKA